MVNNKTSLSQLRAMAYESPEKALSELNNLIETFPYFQAARVLELDILKQYNHKKYKKALRLCALQTSYRDVLYEHLENQNISTNNIPENLSQLSEENTFLAWLDWINSQTQEERSETTKFDWIDDFLERNPKIPSSQTSEKKDLTQSQSLTTNEIMTETLANLYWKQKKYEEAKNAFRVLALKYPEKSGFFADQIKLLEAEMASK
jgi:predicted Zn-dependent protease